MTDLMNDTTATGWYRVLAYYSRLVWLNTVMVVLGLAVVTIPAAMMTGYAGAHGLVARGDVPAWRELGRVFVDRFTASTVVGLPTMFVGALALLAITRSSSPLVAGAAVVALIVAVAVLIAAAYVLALAERVDSSTAWVTVLRELTLRPGTTVGLALPWPVVAYVLLVVPVGLTVPLWVVATSLPAAVGTMLMRRHSRLSSNTP